MMVIDRRRDFAGFMLLISLLVTLLACQARDLDPHTVFLLEPGPCWHGVCPGETTLEDIPPLFEEDPNLARFLLHSNAVSDRTTIWLDSWEFARIGYMTFSDETSDLVHIRLNYLDVTLDEAIALIGEPDQMMVVAASDDRADAIHLYMLYSARGTVLAATTFASTISESQQTFEFKVNERLRMDHVLYLAADYLYQERIPPGAAISEPVPWPGFVDNISVPFK